MITLIHDRDGRNHQRWSSLWQSIRLSWLLLFLLLLLLLGRLGLSLCLLVLLDQLVHLKKMLKNPKNIFNNIREMQNQEYYVASTWSAGRIFIWVFPFSLKKDSSSVGSWLLCCLCCLCCFFSSFSPFQRATFPTKIWSNLVSVASSIFSGVSLVMSRVLLRTLMLRSRAPWRLVSSSCDKEYKYDWNTNLVIMVVYQDVA